jgi:hypothetical protein
MAKPITQITGKLYLPTGVIVTAGTITVWLKPPGQTIQDTSTSTMYKVGFSAVSPVDNTGINSLSVFRTQSLSNAKAYYIAQVDVTSPVQASWRELWRVPTAQGTLTVGEVTVLSATPVL